MVLGDLNARIDWGYSKEYMEAAWQMLQLDRPDDFVIATGEAHSVKEFVEEAFSIVNLRSEDYIVSDQSLFRPTQTSVLIGDTTKAREQFGFNLKVGFKELVKIMVEADLQKQRSKSPLD